MTWNDDGNDDDSHDDGNDGFDDYNYDDNDNNTEHDYMVEDHDANVAALLIQPLVLYQHVIDELSHTGSLELENHDVTKQRVKRDDVDGVDRHWSYDDNAEDIGSGTEEQIDQNGGQTNAPKANLNTHQQEPDHQQQRPALASADVVGLAMHFILY